jgi:hypothetical protein
MAFKKSYELDAQKVYEANAEAGTNKMTLPCRNWTKGNSAELCVM